MKPDIFQHRRKDRDRTVNYDVTLTILEILIDKSVIKLAYYDLCDEMGFL